MSLTIWKPFKRPVYKASCSPSFDSLAKDFFTTSFPTFNHFFDNAATSPNINIVETDKTFDLEIALLGIPKENVKIAVKENLLTVSAEHKASEEKEDTTKKYHRRSFSTSTFKRSFYIPKNVDREGISATHTNGILKVTLPKQVEEVKESTFIDIN